VAKGFRVFAPGYDAVGIIADEDQFASPQKGNLEDQQQI